MVFLRSLRVPWLLSAVGLVVSCSGLSNTGKEPNNASSTSAYIPGIVFERGILALSASILIHDAIPFEFAPDGCYARALLMSARLASSGVPSSQYYVYAQPGAPFEIPWNGRIVRWGYHVAPLMQPYGQEAKIYDPSVSPGDDSPMTRVQWVSKFFSPTTQLAAEVVTPGSCFVTDSASQTPRPGCAQIDFRSSSLVRSLAEMPPFRMQDLSIACTILYNYIAQPSVGFLPNQVSSKRLELTSLVKDIASNLATRGVLEGSPEQLFCGETARE